MPDKYNDEVNKQRQDGSSPSRVFTEVRYHYKFNAKRSKFRK